MDPAQQSDLLTSSLQFRNSGIYFWCLFTSEGTFLTFQSVLPSVPLRCGGTGSFCLLPFTFCLYLSPLLQGLHAGAMPFLHVLAGYSTKTAQFSFHWQAHGPKLTRLPQNILVEIARMDKDLPPSEQGSCCMILGESGQPRTAAWVITNPGSNVPCLRMQAARLHCPRVSFMRSISVLCWPGVRTRPRLLVLCCVDNTAWCRKKDSRDVQQKEPLHQARLTALAD